MPVRQATDTAANVYKSNNLIYKSYNSSLSWSTIEHIDIDKLFENEVSILKIIYPKIIINNKTIIMKYLGKSLFHSFLLPDNWKNQITNLFIDLDKKGIYYPEFNLKNIVVKDNIISFINYGLATISNNSNESNCKTFIEILELLEKQLLKINSTQQKIEYTTFLNNMKIENKYKKNIL